MTFLQSGGISQWTEIFLFLLPGKSLNPLDQGLQALWNRQTYGSILNEMECTMLAKCGDAIYGEEFWN